MLILLSPSKTLDFSSTEVGLFTEPEALGRSQTLINTLRGMTSPQLQDLMKVSADIASLNVARYKDFSPPFNPSNAKQALLAFKGDVYRDWPLETYSEEDFAYAQDHLRILSGLYGALRPMDLIQPYRLEMGTRLRTDAGKNLYEFWGDDITESLNAQGHDIVVNLASNEYFKSVRRKKLKGRLITPVFKEDKGGKVRVLAVYAKRARGAMAHHLLKNRVSDLDGLKAFNAQGYAYQADLSNDAEIVFVRKH